MNQELPPKENNFLENYELQGEILNILTYPAPILKQIATPVEVFDAGLITLCKNMLFTMYNAPGIGLAAPQVGISKRIFVMDIDFDREEVIGPTGEEHYQYSDLNPKVFINPKIYNQSGEILYEEGCLSVPGVYEKVKRSEAISIDYLDMWGTPQTLATEGLFSVCLQHENDHLDGIVFLDRLSLIKKNLLAKKFLKKRKK